MFMVPSYAVAVGFCIVTMVCWGSWANTQKLASKSWSFQLFYWDYTIGVVLLSLLFGLTLQRLLWGARSPRAKSGTLTALVGCSAFRSS